MSQTGRGYHLDSPSDGNLIQTCRYPGYMSIHVKDIPNLDQVNQVYTKLSFAIHVYPMNIPSISLLSQVYPWDILLLPGYPWDILDYACLSLVYPYIYDFLGKKSSIGRLVPQSPADSAAEAQQRCQYHPGPPWRRWAAVGSVSSRISWMPWRAARHTGDFKLPMCIFTCSRRFVISICQCHPSHKQECRYHWQGEYK